MKNYSEFRFAIDLIIDVYGITNPVLIAEKVKEDLGFSNNQIKKGRHKKRCSM